MNRRSEIAGLRVQELIAAIASTDVSPGAGAAGAVTLALGVACASKAVAISLKHHAANKELQAALGTLDKIGSFALDGADRDADAFEAFIRARSTGSAVRLVREGERLSHLIDALLSIIDDIEQKIESNMAGDMGAARALARAARTIQALNQTEAEEARDDRDGSKAQ